ncbi:MAG: YdcF family protein, partial [Acidobacteriaceae bacterium]|nr:YdcF family protein [Acidobacteriaceae bacterium]
MVVIALVWIFRTPLLTWTGELLVEDDGAQKAQAIVVLGGDDSGMRILTAAQLAQAGYAPYVIVDGPKSLLGKESDATIQYAVGKGYAQSLFRPLPLPDAVRSTRAEADCVGRSLKERRIDKILLVTSNYHTRRAAQLFRRSNPKLQIVV